MLPAHDRCFAWLFSLLSHGIVIACLLFPINRPPKTPSPTPITVALWDSASVTPAPSKQDLPDLKQDMTTQPLQTQAKIAIKLPTAAKVLPPTPTPPLPKKSSPKKQNLNKKPQPPKTPSPSTFNRVLNQASQAILTQTRPPSPTSTPQQSPVSSQDLIHYITTVAELIRAKLVYPDTHHNLKAQFRVYVLKNGTVDRVALVRSSGVAAYDEAAMRAIHAIGKMPPLPDGQAFVGAYREWLIDFRLKEGL